MLSASESNQFISTFLKTEMPIAMNEIAGLSKAIKAGKRGGAHPSIGQIAILFRCPSAFSPEIGLVRALRQVEFSSRKSSVFRAKLDVDDRD